MWRAPRVGAQGPNAGRATAGIPGRRGDEERGRKRPRGSDHTRREWRDEQRGYGEGWEDEICRSARLRMRAAALVDAADGAPALGRMRCDRGGQVRTGPPVATTPMKNHCHDQTIEGGPGCQALYCNG